MSKLSAVEKDLKQNGSITNWEIATRYYTTCPQKIIECLRKKHGYDAITDEWQSKKVEIDGKKETVIWKKYIWNGGENAGNK